MGSQIFQRNQRTAADDRSAHKLVYAVCDTDFISAQGMSACGEKQT